MMYSKEPTYHRQSSIFEYGNDSGPFEKRIGMPDEQPIGFPNENFLGKRNLRNFFSRQDVEIQPEPDLPETSSPAYSFHKTLLKGTKVVCRKGDDEGGTETDTDDEGCPSYEGDGGED